MEQFRPVVTVLTARPLSLMSRSRVPEFGANWKFFFPPSMAGTDCVRRDVLYVLSDWLSALGPALASSLRAGIGGDGGAPGVPKAAAVRGWPAG